MNFTTLIKNSSNKTFVTNFVKKHIDEPVYMYYKYFEGKNDLIGLEFTVDDFDTTHKKEYNGSSQFALMWCSNMGDEGEQDEIKEEEGSDDEFYYTCISLETFVEYFL